MDATTETHIAGVLAAAPGVQLGILFGSVARGEERCDSDLDLAVMGNREPLPAASRRALIESLAQQEGRPVDLVDLQTARGVIVGQVLRTGRRIYEADPEHRLYAGLLKRHAFYQADFAPYRRRLLAERRRTWTEH